MSNPFNKLRSGMHPAEFNDRIQRALKVELLATDTASPLLRFLPELKDLRLLDHPTDGLVAEMRLVSPALRDNVVLRATVLLSLSTPRVRLIGALLPIGDPFEVVTGEDLAWLTV